MIGLIKDLEKFNCNKFYNKDVDEVDKSKVSKFEDFKICNSGRVFFKDFKDFNNNVFGEEFVFKRILYVFFFGKF